MINSVGKNILNERELLIIDNVRDGKQIIRYPLEFKNNEGIKILDG